MTGAMSTVRMALTRLYGSGATSLRDAVQLGIQLAPQDDETRPLVLLFTDGHDTSSFSTEDDVLELARRSGIVTHVVQVESTRSSSGSCRRREQSGRSIDRIAESVGLQTAATLREHFRRILKTTPSAYRRAFFVSARHPAAAASPSGSSPRR
jgi:AraC-like DNA-binding protein